MPKFYDSIRAIALGCGLACCVAIGAMAQVPDWMPKVTSQGQPLNPSIYPHPGLYFTGVDALAYNRDGSLIAVSARNGAIAVLEPAAGKTRAAWYGGKQRSLTFAADGSLVSGGGGVKVWDPDSGKLLRTLNTTGTTVAASADGKLLASADQGAVHLWEAATGAKLRTFKVGLLKEAGTLAFSADGRFVAVVEKGKMDKIKLFEVETGKSVRTVGESEDIRTLAFSPDGLLLASADKVWEVNTGRQLYSQDKKAFGGVAFSPDGHWMISEGSGGIPVLREVATGKETYVLAGHKASIQSAVVSFHPGGKIVATGGWDNTVRFWDIEAGRELGVAPVPHIWEVLRAELENCDGKEGTSSSESPRVRCTVWATLRNTSGRKAWLPSAHYMIYLYQGSTKISELSDLA